MLKTLISTVTILTTIALPISVYAQTAIEDCVNSQMETGFEGWDFTEAKLLATEKDEGYNYHLIALSNPKYPRASNKKSVFKEGQGVCEVLIFNPGGDQINFADHMPARVAESLQRESAKFTQKLIDEGFYQP